MTANNLGSLLESIIPIVRKGGETIMEIYQTDFEVKGKADSSPVTLADERAEQVMVPLLKALLPGVPVIAEEAVAAGEMPDVADTFWLVDPLDGTKEFINRNGEFTVNIALIVNGVAVLGVVYAPAQGRLFAGAVDSCAFVEQSTGRSDIRCRVVPEAGLTVVASRSHGDSAALDSFLGQSGHTVADVVNAGSSLKLCLVAAGEADVYPRLGRTMEWDIAAGHAVLSAAGGRVEAISGEPLEYGKPGFENPHFVAWGHSR
ncbi:3'(2'),5'-bisphosphate nucleotidase CysQ [Advenella sp. FME57]|uniref:3'(2'),5'-bisphosphate nucleotidase CysQ n=1 Tax=Advenella sp. FME57 TaxID=2742604 RepID=UPI0018687796